MKYVLNTILIAFFIFTFIPFGAYASQTNGTIDGFNYTTTLLNNTHNLWSSLLLNTGKIFWNTQDPYNVHVTDSELTGYLWGSGIGWISLSCANTNSCGSYNFKVTNNGEGILRGYAWGENTGWINFSCANTETNNCSTNNNANVSIDSAGNFSGYAWSQNFGWIRFDCGDSTSCVKTDWRPLSVRSTNNNQGGGGGGGGGSGGINQQTGIVTLSGLAYPGTLVNVLRDGVIAVAANADPGAQFKVSLNLSVGTYVLSLYAIDKDGKKSPPYSTTVTMTDGSNIIINNIFIAPTIGVSSDVVKKGDPIGIFGSSAPDSQVNVYVHSAKEYVEKIDVKSTGAWYKQFDTSFLELGDHLTFARAIKGTQVTEKSNDVAFVVGTATINNTPKCDLRGDLNGDCKVNTIDLSILLYYWHKAPPAKNPKVDIIKNGIIDASDLSILLYEWTG